MATPPASTCADRPRHRCDVRASDRRRRAAPLTIEDRALYIYTSGTTGMPKAANINHYRLMLASFAFAGVMETRATDRMYDCLPMYHTAGGAGGDRRAAGQRRLGGDPREVFGARVLGRHRALGLHAVPVYRRALPLPRQLATAPEGDRASLAARLRQRAAARHLGTSSSAGFASRTSSSSMRRPKAM